MNKPVSPRRKSPEKKNVNIQDTLQAAKRTFLTSTETKSPLKRPLTPEQEQEEISSSVKKVGIVTPSPHKKAKVSWKTRWQSTVGGGAAAVRGGGRRGAKTEADKLLGDEGVIQMLNRVPSVHGIMPKSASNSSNRVQRVRSVAARPNVKPEKKKNHKKVEEVRKVVAVKQEPVEDMEVQVVQTNGLRFTNGGEFVSPKRAVKNMSRDYSELQDTLRAVKSDDCFTHLTELPAEQMDLLMNCDIRYSLPKQGGPRALAPGPKTQTISVSGPKIPAVTAPGPKTQGVTAPWAKTQGTKAPIATSQGMKAPAAPKLEEPSKPVKAEVVAKASPDSSSSLVKVRPVTVSVLAKSHGVKALFPPPARIATDGSIAELLTSYREREERADCALPSLSPGQYSNIYVRLYDTFAQVTLASPRTRLKGSLTTAAMEEIVHALSYVAAAPRLRGLLVTGIGTVFCQGVDLTELCQDKRERRAEQAALLAAALERLLTALAAFPKLLVAAVNGAAVGLGVTMLPLFDIVWANDKAQFNTFYTRLGQIPEGCASVLLPTASPIREMLLLGRVLTAQECVTLGLVTQAFFPGRLMEEAIPRMRRATGDALGPGLQWNKMLLKQNQKLQVENAIDGEIELLKEMWSSKEFHVNLVNFVNSEKCLQFQKPAWS